MFLFENLEVYEKSVVLTKKVHQMGRSIPNRPINDQMLRAVLSIPLNIAEGQGRIHCREKKQFYNTAKGSLYECVPLLQLCFELKYIDEVLYRELYSLMEEVSKALSGLIKSVKEI